MKSKISSHFVSEINQSIGSYVNSFDLTNNNIVIGLISIVHTIIHNMEIVYPGIETDLMFNYDPNPYLIIFWKEQTTGLKDDFMFRFNPFRLELKKTELIEAHDRAMSII